MLGPTSHCSCCPVMGNHSIIALVATLFFLCCPSTIGRSFQLHTLIAMPTSVRAIVVNPVNRMLVRWRLTHVGQECLKISPSQAHINSPASVSIVFVVVGVRASMDDVAPYGVFSCFGFAMNELAALMSTSAGPGPSRGQVAQKNAALCSAVAPTDPVRTIRPFVVSNNRQHSESLIRDVLECASVLADIGISHDVRSLKADVAARTCGTTIPTGSFIFH